MADDFNIPEGTSGFFTRMDKENVSVSSTSASKPVSRSFKDTFKDTFKEDAKKYGAIGAKATVSGIESAGRGAKKAGGWLIEQSHAGRDHARAVQEAEREQDLREHAIRLKEQEAKLREKEIKRREKLLASVPKGKKIVKVKSHPRKNLKKKKAVKKHARTKAKKKLTRKKTVRRKRNK